jgi:small subunit ribosomal protein S16
VVVKIDAERAQYWIGKGAQPSDTVRSLLKKQSEAAKATAAK